MQTFIQKVSSRKFLMAISGIVTGVVLIANGVITEGVAAIMSSILGYMVMEGYIDAKAVQAAVTAAQEVANAVEVTEDDSDA